MASRRRSTGTPSKRTGTAPLGCRQARVFGEPKPEGEIKMLMNGKTTRAFTEQKKAPVTELPVQNPAVPPYVDEAGDNVRLEGAGDILTITIDLSKDFGLSSSGRTHTVASTRGWSSIGTHRGVSIGLNVIRK